MLGSKLAVIKSCVKGSRCVKTVGVVLLSNLAAKWAGSILCVIIILLVFPLISSPYKLLGRAKAQEAGGGADFRPNLPGVKVRRLTGEGLARDRELRRIPEIRDCWAKVKELRRGAKGVAVGVVEAEEAAEVRRLLLRMGEDTVREKAFLGDMTVKQKIWGLIFGIFGNIA